MRYLLPLLLLAAPAVQAQDLSGYVLSADVGIGASYGPSYMGSDEDETSPWLILRNGSLSRPTADGATTDGFSVVPSFNYVGRRDADDFDSLSGMDDIKAAGEVGLRLGYDQGPSTGYVTLRKGFGGHHGVTGEFGAKYRYDASDRLTLWGIAEAKYGDNKFNDTYFGVTDDEAVTSQYDSYSPGGGIYAASVGVQARYSLTENMAVLGEVEYERLLGDSADSPLVEDKGQPKVKLGIVRHFDFRF